MCRKCFDTLYGKGSYYAKLKAGGNFVYNRGLFLVRDHVEWNSPIISSDAVFRDGCWAQVMSCANLNGRTTKGGKDEACLLVLVSPGNLEIWMLDSITNHEWREDPLPGKVLRDVKQSFRGQLPKIRKQCSTTASEFGSVDMDALNLSQFQPVQLSSK